MSITEVALSITYKLKLPDDVSIAAVYFTVTKKHGFFINCKVMDNFMLYTALMTQFSRRLQEGGDIRNIIEDMKKSSDPKGGYMTKEGKVNGLIHHLGLVLEKHADLVKNKEIWNV